MAREGLARRARASGLLADETSFLTPLDEIADSGLTLADRQLALYHGAWGGDVRKAFQDFAF